MTRLSNRDARRSAGRAAYHLVVLGRKVERNSLVVAVGIAVLRRDRVSTIVGGSSYVCVGVLVARTVLNAAPPARKTRDVWKARTKRGGEVLANKRSPPTTERAKAIVTIATPTNQPTNQPTDSR